jgi:hypothetical protein
MKEAICSVALSLMCGATLGACGSAAQPAPTPVPSTIEPEPDDGAGEPSAPSASASPGACAARRGTYRVEFGTLSGDCGDFDPVSFDPDDCTQYFCVPHDSSVTAGRTWDPSTWSAEVSGSVSLSADRCDVAYSYEFPLSSQPGAMKIVGKISWRADGERGQGDESVTLFDGSGAVLCSGRYSVIVTKL